MPIISVIVPVYNVEEYIDRCINSIRNQTYTDYELILVDDGSPDKSGLICDKYASLDSRIHVIHKQNGGLSSARNAGIEMASGKYIMFVDADDMIHCRAIELQIAAVEENNSDALVCPLKRFSNDEVIDINTPVRKLEGVSVISGIEAEKGFFNNLNANMYVSSCGKVLKRSLFDTIRFPEGRLFEDEFVTYRLYYESRRIVVVNTELYFYYINEAGITRTLNLDKRFDEYDAQVERIRFFKEKGLIELYHLALLEFLRSSQWDLIKCQKRNEEHNKKRGACLQKQYTEALRQAEQEKQVFFTNSYDYYVLAYPQKKTLFRVKRLIYKLIGKMR